MSKRSRRPIFMYPAISIDPYEDETWIEHSEAQSQINRSRDIMVWYQEEGIDDARWVTLEDLLEAYKRICKDGTNV